MTPKLTGEGDGAEVPKKALQFSPINTATFEPRHENKTCSACLE